MRTVSYTAPELTWDAVIGLGSNLGERETLLQQAVFGLSRVGEVIAVSNVYETPPLGPPQPDYLNAAVRLRTGLEPHALLAATRDIERAAGRERRERWGPRTLDLDLLWIRDQSIDTPELRVPHPELHRRAFALLPLLDVAPEAADPRTGARYRDLLSQLEPYEVRRTTLSLLESASSAVDTPTA